LGGGGIGINKGGKEWGRGYETGKNFRQKRNLLSHHKKGRKDREKEKGDLDERKVRMTVRL
jgi:hypothetical protein